MEAKKQEQKKLIDWSSLNRLTTDIDNLNRFWGTETLTKLEKHFEKLGGIPSYVAVGFRARAEAIREAHNNLKLYVSNLLEEEKSLTRKR